MPFRSSWLRVKGETKPGVTKGWEGRLVLNLLRIKPDVISRVSFIPRSGPMMPRCKGAAAASLFSHGAGVSTL
jgi:hypothetical protein